MKKIFIAVFIGFSLLFAFTSNKAPVLSFYFKDFKCDYVLHKKYFDVCYSCSRKEPVFVAYSLKGNLVNKNLYKRDLTFRPDYNLPRGCRSYPSDYTHSGYDRGHNAPNADFDFDRKAQKETFLMSNISPQAKWLNRKYWAKLEKLERFLAVKYGKDEVITGSFGFKGRLKHGVVIPKYWFKIIFADGKIAAFLAPNVNEGMKKANIKKYRIPFAELMKILKENL